MHNRISLAVREAKKSALTLAVIAGCAASPEVGEKTSEDGDVDTAVHGCLTSVDVDTVNKVTLGERTRERPNRNKGRADVT